MHHALTLDALRVLEAIREHGSFAAAAGSLYRVPSALTYTIQKLESDLGVALFDRQGQKAVLTSAGELVISEGQKLLYAADSLEDKVRQLDSGWETRLVIAKDTIIPTLPLLKIIGDFCALDKQVEISVIEEALGGGWDALHNQRADLAIGLTGELPKGQFNLTAIGHIDFVFVVAATHPLADYMGVIQGDLISQYPSIIVADSSRSLPTRSSGIYESRQQIRVSSMQAKLDALELGLGTGFLPFHIAKASMDQQHLIAKSVAIPRPSMPVYMASPKAKNGLALQWFEKQMARCQWFSGN